MDQGGFGKRYFLDPLDLLLGKLQSILDQVLYHQIIFLCPGVLKVGDGINAARIGYLPNRLAYRHWRCRKPVLERR